jgi:hypothetical protein
MPYLFSNHESYVANGKNRGQTKSGEKCYVSGGQAGRTAGSYLVCRKWQAVSSRRLCNQFAWSSSEPVCKTTAGL